jgi:dTDP-glucose 4,6-dehydratase
MKLLVTGGAGFIGSNFIRYWLTYHPEDHIVNFDALTYAGNLDNLKEFEKDSRYTFVHGDIGDANKVKSAMYDVDVVVNFAAESHNDRAVLDPAIFLKTNVLGTQTLLEVARNSSITRFHHISTCEVFGDLSLDDARAFKETDAYAPRTPYNASKASANHVVMSYFHTFGVPVSISHCANNYGPYQFPEKLIPLFTINALQDKKLPLYRSSQNKREWLHVDDHCRAIDLIIQKGKIGEAYNIGSGVEKSVEEITDSILKKLVKPETLKEYVEDRLGHDRRYLLDITKIQHELGWQPSISFENGIDQTIQWYIDHQDWWQKLIDHAKI